MQQKVNHLTILARALLPSADNITTVQDRLHKLLGSLDEDDEMFDRPPMTLRQIRKAAIAANTHQQAWFANDGVTPHKLSVGDLGYIPKGSVAGEKNWDEFVVLCNVLDQGLARLETTTVTEGQQGSWQGGFHKWDELVSYELPGGIHGYVFTPSIFHPTPDGFRRWTVVVPPEAEYTMNIVHTHQVTRVHDAWNYLLEQGNDMAAAHGINPEDLILSERCPQTTATAYSFDSQLLRPGSHQSRYRPALPRARPPPHPVLARLLVQRARRAPRALPARLPRRAPQSVRARRPPPPRVRRAGGR